MSWSSIRDDYQLSLDINTGKEYNTPIVDWGFPAEVSIRRSNANLHFSKGATLMKVLFVTYLKKKNKKEKLLKVAEINMAKQSQIA